MPAVRPSRSVGVPRTATRFGILGPLEALDGGRPVPLGGARARLALAVLLVSVNEVVSGEALATALWPGRESSEARNAVQTQVSRLRTAVGSERLETVGTGYRLRLAPAELDALAFTDGAARAAAALSAGSVATAEAEATAALACWRGPALVEVADHDFARARAAELEERRLATIECRTEARLSLGRSAEVVAELRALVDEHPFRERLWGQLMVALYREGRQADALRTYSNLRTTLAEELGIDPSPELVALEGAILRQEVPPAPRRDDLDQLEHLWALSATPRPDPRHCRMAPTLLDGLAEHERREVMRVARRRRFARKEVVFHEGDPGDTLHLIVRGSVAVRITTPLGDEGILRVLGPGQVFGELALIDPAPRVASIVAVEPCETLALHTDQLTELRRRHPSVNDVLLGAVVAELRRVSAQLVEVMYVPAEKRVHRRLLELHRLFGNGERGTTIPLTQAELAQLTGATRSTVNRILREAESVGYLRVERARLHVLDEAELARRAG